MTNCYIVVPYITEFWMEVWNKHREISEVNCIGRYSVIINIGEAVASN